MFAWITMFGDDKASPELAACLDKARGPAGRVDNVMRVHSLRPHTRMAHRALYMSILHDDGNELPMWFQEVIASWVSILNRCDYALTNLFANARHLIGDDGRADAILTALKAGHPEDAFETAQLAMLRYARKLTLEPAAMVENDLADMRACGVDDGAILEVNQICAYFNHVDRLHSGLGVTLEGVVVGFYVTPEEAESRRYGSGAT